MKESTLHQKLENIVRAGKPKTIRHEGKTCYISKEKIRECEKEGGILPLLTIIPSVLGRQGQQGLLCWPNITRHHYHNYNKSQFHFSVRHHYHNYNKSQFHFKCIFPKYTYNYSPYSVFFMSYYIHLVMLLAVL